MTKGVDRLYNNMIYHVLTFAAVHGVNFFLWVTVYRVIILS